MEHTARLSSCRAGSAGAGDAQPVAPAPIAHDMLPNAYRKADAASDSHTREHRLGYPADLAN